jgi:hypothetical protein
LDVGIHERPLAELDACRRAGRVAGLHPVDEVAVRVAVAESGHRGGMRAAQALERGQLRDEVVGRRRRLRGARGRRLGRGGRHGGRANFVRR